MSDKLLKCLLGGQTSPEDVLKWLFSDNSSETVKNNFFRASLTSLFVPLFVSRVLVARNGSLSHVSSILYTTNLLGMFPL